MKNLFLYVALCCVVTACNFSAGTKKDLISGLSVSYNGFTISEAVLVDAQNERKLNNEVDLNSTVAIVVQGIANYELKDGHAFPGLDLIVTDKAGVAVLEGMDILANEEGYTPEDAAVLRGTITAGNPMVAGETYHAKMKIWDKLKPESVIDVQVDIVVK